jgi:hypothetical protein
MDKNVPQPEEVLPEDLDQALDDMDNKLNLTADEKDLSNKLSRFSFNLS